jgi:hypothetical protein
LISKINKLVSDFRYYYNIIKVCTFIIEIFVKKEKYILKVLGEIYWTKQLVIRHVKVSKITRMSLIRHISNF